MVGRKQIYVVGATNRPDMIDSAMLRPGMSAAIDHQRTCAPCDTIDVDTHVRAKDGSTSCCTCRCLMRLVAHRFCAQVFVCNIVRIVRHDRHAMRDVRQRHDAHRWRPTSTSITSPPTRARSASRGSLLVVSLCVLCAVQLTLGDTVPIWRRCYARPQSLHFARASVSRPPRNRSSQCRT
jgi:hypothetical protein